MRFRLSLYLCTRNDWCKDRFVGLAMVAFYLFGPFHRNPVPPYARQANFVAVLVILLSIVSDGFEHARSAEVDSVEVFAQPNPGQPSTMIDMSVYPAPVSPPSVRSDQVRLTDDELVIGIVIDQKPMAYPVRFMAMVEVVNDVVEGVPIAPTWCPLSGTGVIFFRKIHGEELTFDFGTGLKGDNLLIVDRETKSVWSQLQHQAISGEHKDDMISALPSIQTTWKAWKSSYPNTDVMVFPGHQGYPYFYQDFRNPASGIAAHDTSELGLGLELEGESRFYPFATLATHEIPVIDVVKEKQVEIYFDQESITAWATDTDKLLLLTMVAYKEAWLEFFPDSRIFE